MICSDPLNCFIRVPTIVITTESDQNGLKVIFTTKFVTENSNFLLFRSIPCTATSDISSSSSNKNTNSTVRVFRLSFRFLWLWCNDESDIKLHGHITCVSIWKLNLLLTLTQQFWMKIVCRVSVTYKSKITTFLNFSKQIFKA